jgi:subtilisin family serine protease
MCDTIAGELLLSFHESDAAGYALIEQIHSLEIPHVSVIAELKQHVADTAGSMRPLQFNVYKLAVPEGEENYKVGYLQFFYKHALFQHHDKIKNKDVLARSNYHLQVVPHSWLSVNHAANVPSPIGFSLTKTHDDYKNLLGWVSTPTTKPKRVLVLDTGLDDGSAATVIERVNFVNPADSANTTDDHGHGTAVTEIINDLSPSTKFIVFKVADSKGRASEWDTLAALGADNNADIANISLSFGLGDTACSVCGRESRSSRSAVFENVLDQLDKDPNGPLIVAAAGNRSLPELSFPARFENVIAIESINQSRQLSAFSNRGTLDHDGKSHPNVFVLPGGERQKNLPPTEYVGTSAAGAEYWGTSFAAAYASGLIAALWSQAGNSEKSREQMLNYLRQNADSALPNYLSLTHGNGMMRFV